MPDSFVVTTPSTTIPLGQDRRGEIAITVTNVTGRELRARLLIVPTEPAKAEWFAIAGDSERPFGLGATQSYTVQINVPPVAAPGTFTFRADAAAEDRPEEDFAHGPNVAMTVPAAAKKKPFPWWIVIVAVVVVVAIIIGVVIGTSGGKTKNATVPNVNALHASAGIGALRNAGFKPNPAAFSGPCDPTITGQVPAANTTAKKGSTVNLTFVACTTPGTTTTVNPNLVAVPPVLGKSFTIANQLLIGAGLIPKFENAAGLPFTFQIGTHVGVTSVAPPVGTRVPKGSQVIVLVFVCQFGNGCGV